MKEKLPQGNYLIDLHLHTDGALSVDTVRKLAEMQGTKLPTEDREELLRLLSAPRDCQDLNEYLKCFSLPCSLMQSRDTVREAFFRIKEELKADGLLYVELRFAPQLHTRQGLEQEEVLLAALEGCRCSDLRSNLILCCMRGRDNHAANLETVRLAAKYRDRGVAAIDLAGAEALYPTGDFAELFAYGRELGLRFTIHAGEADGPESVAKALDFGASRIGHGVRSTEDEALFRRLADSGVTLELCLSSNLQTKAAKSLESYPLKRLMDRGITVTLNTDNPTVSATTMRKELELARESFGLTDRDIKDLLLNSVNSSFADEETKQHLRGRVEKAFR